MIRHGSGIGPTGTSTTAGVARVDRRAWGSRVAIVVVLVVAVGLRFWRLDLTEYKYDEAAWLRLAEDIARFGQLPLAGLRSSQGILAPPHFAYLLAPVVLVSRQPLVASGFVALANVAGIVGALWLAWRAFGPLAGVTGMLLYAANPWAVVYSRKIWQPDVLAPVAVLLFIALERGVVGRRDRWAATTFPIVALGAMIHLSFAGLAPLLLAPMFVLGRARRWRLLGVGLGLALLTVAPFVAYEQSTAWLDVQNLRSYQAQRGTSTTPDALGYAFGLATGWATSNIANVPLREDIVPTRLVGLATGLESALIVGSVVLVGALLVARGSAMTRATRLRLSGLLAWLTLPVLLTLRHSIALYPHYYLLLLPAPFLLVGAAAQWLAERSTAWPRAVLTIGLGIVLLTSTVQLGATKQFIDHLGSAYEPCYGLPLRTTMSMVSDLTDFGRKIGAGRASIEDDEADAQAFGYLLRPNFPHVDLVPSGAGASGTALVEPAASGIAPEVQTSPGGTELPAASVIGTWMPAGVEPDWRVHLGLGWRFDESPTASRPVRWQVQLGDGPAAVTEAGIGHRPSDTGGQPLVSWFTLEVPPDLPRGAYPLRLKLLDSSTPIGFTRLGAGGGQIMSWQVETVMVGQSPRCDSN